MQVQELRLAGLKLISPRIFKDERGFFFESYQDELYLKNGIGPFVQDNVSFSRQGVIRGLHFQSEPGQAKLVSCLKGEIWDVAVDIRFDSPTFMHWEAIHLNDQNCCQLYIPVGFAHGYCVLSESAHVQYKVSSRYHPNTEKSIRWNDPSFAINWPVKTPVLSTRDQLSPTFQEVSDALDYRM